jgi:uncharacterized membrane protein
MIRFLIYLFAGLVLAAIIHLGTILVMPHVSTNSAWQRVSAEVDFGTIRIFDGSNEELAQALKLDPAFVHAICPLSLGDEPYVYFGDLPNVFWTAALVAADGSVPYSTTSRTNANGEFNLAIFNANQALGLAAGDYELDPSMTIVKVESDKLIAVVRLFPSHRTQRAQIAKQLRETLVCEPL